MKSTKPYLATRRLYFRTREALRPTTMGLLAPFSGQRVLPDFLIVGATKAGTTSLLSYLCQHPGIVAPLTKEVGYLNNPDNFQRGENWYRAHFPRASYMRSLSARLHMPTVTGEATPAMNIHSYAVHAHELVPKAKIIMVLRDPVERAYSHYRHQLRKKGRESLGFWDALMAEPDRIAQDLIKNDNDMENVGSGLRWHSYMQMGQYIDHIEYWLQHFPREQLILINFAELVGNGNQVCNDIASALDLPAYGFETTRVANQGIYNTDMDQRCREYLVEYFKPYNKRLFAMLGEDWGWQR